MTCSIRTALVGRGPEAETETHSTHPDYNKPNERHLVFLQGDTRHAGNSSDGVIARSQIAEVLINSLTSDQALRKTFELVAIAGPAQRDLEKLFSALNADPENTLEGVRDTPDQPLDEEPQRVKDDMRNLSTNRR